MNKAFEKILKKIEEKRNKYQRLADNSNFDGWYAEDIEYSAKAEMCEELKEIVHEIAEEYTSTEHINCSTNTSTNGWIPIKTRPMTEEEKEYYSEYLFEGNGLIYECPLPDDEQEVLITTKYGHVEKTTFYQDGCYFEEYEDYDDVIAWRKLPQPYKDGEKND